MSNQSAVDFPGSKRIHMGLAVTDMQRSGRFYETLLGSKPTKTRPGYMKFEPEDPSVNLTLNQVHNPEGARKAVTHFGIQVKSVDAVRQAIARLSQAGLETRTEEGTTCCYAVQDKVWVSDPDGNQWEVFVVLEKDAPQNDANTSACCLTELKDTDTCPCG